MKLAVISGSVREGAESLRISKWLESRLVDLGVDMNLINLREYPLPFLPDTVWDGTDEKWKFIKEKLEWADGYVIVSPEWNGMAPPQLKLLLQYAADTEAMAHKPVMLVGVSSGRGGTYPLVDMRATSAKNNHFVFSPESLIVGGCEKMFLNDSFDESEPDIQLKNRAVYALKILVEYAKALAQVRSSGVIDHKNFGSGV